MSDHPVLYIDLIEDVPFSREEWEVARASGLVSAGRAESYDEYRERFQPWRWNAKRDGNFEIMARGESYFNKADAEAAIETLFGGETIVYKGEAEVGNTLLRHPPEWPAS